MRLEDFRILKEFSYQELSQLLGLSEQKTYRICIDKKCVKLADAHKIQRATRGMVDMVDLLPEDCT